jgi:predicted O-methyltransferase YrrM
MDSLSEQELAGHFADILKIFEELGYPQALIGQWTLPWEDARTLMGIFQAAGPKNVLEVGTFVGVTTLLMALLSPEATHIHSIDPNFPLELEMASMKSELYDFDTSIRAQELALKATRKLGVDRKITFHEGGFSSGNTFASYNTSPASRIAVVGPDVCRNHGPFDFIFIDGLHYEEDVYGDISLAAGQVTPSGVIAIHDVLGRWGSNVRRGVFRFLEEHPDYHFSHDHYAKLYESIGLLRRYAKGTAGHYKQLSSGIKEGSLFQAGLLSNLAAVLVNSFTPSSVVQVGGDLALLERLTDLGVTQACGYVLSGAKVKETSFPVKLFPPTTKSLSEERYDLCLCLEVGDELPDAAVDDLVQACVDLSDTIVFAASPPGEMGNYQKHNRPLTAWIRKFFDRGYLFADVIRPVLEPHVEATFAAAQQNSSYLLNLYLVRKEPALTGGSIEKAKLEEIVLSKERRIEDMQLQNLYQRCIIDHERQIGEKMYEKYHDTFHICQSLMNDIRVLHEQIAVTNVFNRRVLDNTLKRIKEIIRHYISLVFSGSHSKS